MPASQTLPIELHFWPTPNGQKISIALEEFGVPYAVHFVDIGKGDQLKPGFLAISPNNRIPAIVDPEGPDGKPISVFESGAILIYLADKFGRFYGSNARERVAITEWLMWQMAGVGPMFGQFNHFHDYAPEKLPYAITRYTDEVHRLYRVLNTQLKGKDYVAGPYSIADMALYAWTRNWSRREVDAETEFPDFVAWSNRMAARPAVQKGMALKKEGYVSGIRTEEERKILFGQR